jgi:hypothetical protein
LGGGRPVWSRWSLYDGREVVTLQDQMGWRRGRFCIQIDRRVVEKRRLGSDVITLRKAVICELACPALAIMGG